jgi:hypothetical protein
MKTKELIVPVDAIVEVAKMLEVAQTINTITGTTEDEEIIVEIKYEHEDRQLVSDLEEVIANCTEEEDEDEY